MKCYLDSKLCQVTSMLTLERVLKTEGANVHCYAVHPGMINVDLYESIGFGAVLGNIICRVIFLNFIIIYICLNIICITSFRIYFS